MDPLIKELIGIVGKGAVLSERDELLVYECDGLPQHKYAPRAVVFPKSTEEVALVIRALARSKVPVAPRGAGTGLSGGALALNSGVVIELARMRKLLMIDPEHRIARVETGFINAHVSRAAAGYGLYYAPDPSSQAACTIGGNIAENAGGIHCLKYGTTVDHILSARVILQGGEVVELLSPEEGGSGYDLLGLFVGSEGTFGICTEATLRLSPNPQSVRTLLADFLEVDNASRAVSAIIAAGLVPAALEMIDGAIIRAVEASAFAAGLPTDASAALLIELDGIEAGLADDVIQAQAICIANGARTVKVAEDENARKKLWAARKGAFGAMGRISPDLMLQDAVVPRSKLPFVLSELFQLGKKYNLLIANVFHAGDGNLHPFICYDSRIPGEVERVKEAGRELIETCVRAGGTITGEHGVGLDKREYLPLVFSEDDMDAMLGIRRAFDPAGLLNPEKIIPMLSGCGEGRRFSTNLNEVEKQAAGFVDNSLPVVTARGYIDLAKTSVGVSTPHFSFETSFDKVRAAVEIERIVGSEYVDLQAGLTVEPASLAEVQEVFSLANSHGWPIIPAGAGTWLGAGHTDVSRCIAVKTSRMARIIEYEPSDLVATAEAGISLSSFNRYLINGGRQWLALDPPNDGSATIGGLAATGLGGAQALGYGAPRNSIIGMHVLLADGRVIKSGGRVVKNVAGYDLCKLFTGSYGTLGLILDVTFKLRPVPARQCTVVAQGKSAALLNIGQRIIQSNIGPVALELLSPGIGRFVDKSFTGSDTALMIRFAGNDKSVQFQVARALELISAEDGGVQTILNDADEELWDSLAALPLRFADMTISRAKLTLRGMTSLISNCPLPRMWHGGLGDGRIRMIEDDDEDAERRIRVVKKSVEANGGRWVLETARPEIKEAVGVWGEFAGEKIMRRIKTELDPMGGMSPGRFWA